MDKRFIAVAGGTGVVGRHVVRGLEAAGHSTVVLARSRGVDVLNDPQLAAALRGAHAIVDVTNVQTLRGETATRFFTTVTRRLHEAGAAAGVRHLVTLSIVGAVNVPRMGYYEGKARQEEAVRSGPLPATILRATQFYELASQLLSRARLGPLAVLPKMRIQPVAASTVAERLVALALGAPQGAAADIAGPKRHDMHDLARGILHARRKRGVVVALPMPGPAGKAIAGGALLPGDGAEVAGPTFEEWLGVPQNVAT